MALIVTIGNQKGGVGKSTCAMLAANALSQAPFNYRLAVVDIDRQQSIAQRRALDLHGFEGVLPYEVISYNFETFLDRLKVLDQTYDIIILDVAGKLDTEAKERSEAVKALLYTDILFIPLTAGNFSLDASLNYLKIALDVRAKREADGQKIKIVAFRNMHRERSKHVRALGSEIDELKKIVDIPIMKEPLKRYSLFEDADTLTSFYDLDSSDLAKRNYSRWIKELNNILKS